MADDILIEARIMNRVRRLYLLRKILHPMALKSYVGAVLAAAGVSLVSVSNVLSNALTASTPSAAFGFATQALMHTEPLVQAIFLAAAALGVFLLRDIVAMAMDRKVALHSA
jgi:hypothetical protein